MKKILNFLKNPSTLFIVLWYIITAGAIAFAITCVVLNTMPDILAYISYFVAAITLAYTVYTLVKIVPKAKNGFKTLMRKNKYLGRLVDDYSFRTLIFAIGSFGICFAYAIFNAYIGISRRSIWYGALAAYYFMLFAMRSVVLNYHRKKRKRDLDELTEKRKEANITRVCGILLVLLPICLYFAIIPMITGKNSFAHPGIMIYVSAAYAFTKITMSIYNIFKAHKNEDYTIRAIRGVNLADAMVSILALQTAMFMEFSPDSPLNGAANGLTGAAVCILTAAVGTLMIVEANKRIKKLRVQKTTSEGSDV